MLHIEITSVLKPLHVESIHRIWNTVYPTTIIHDSVAETETYLSKLIGSEHMLLLDDEDKLHAWLSHFERENERWFVMLLDKTVQGRGWGSKLLDKAKEQQTVLNGWVIDKHDYVKTDGQPYRSPLPFYIKNGFKVFDNVRLELEILSAVMIQWNRDENKN